MTHGGAGGLASVRFPRLSAPRTLRPSDLLTDHDVPLTCSGTTALLLWAGYLISAPFYLFASGLPQPADFCLAALIGLVGIVRGVRVANAYRPLCRSLAGLIGYVALVNGVWAIALEDASPLVSTVYFVFNGLAVVAFAQLDAWLGRRFATWTINSIVASVLLQAALAWLSSNGAGRSTAFFNNPNQLGYYAILYGTLFWIASSRWRVNGLPRVLVEGTFYLSVLYLSAVSLSRACLASSVLLVAASLLLRRAVLIPTVVGLAIVTPLAESQLGLLSQFNSRVAETARDLHGELLYRGYDRIWNHPEYLLFGAGEGAYTRFHSHINLELHSSLGTLLFCYGLIGLLLFFRTIAVLVRDCGWRVLWYFAPAMAYGLTHNGLRQTEFWLIAVLIVCIHARTTKSINARESHVNFTPSSTMRREIQTIQTL